jgi:hypothetical protein
VVAGGEATLAIGKGGKNFTYFLRLRTQWWWWIAHAMFTWTLKWGPHSLYRPKFHSLNGGNNIDRETLNRGKQCIILQYMEQWLRSQKWMKMLRSRNLRSGLHCIYKNASQTITIPKDKNTQNKGTILVYLYTTD